MAEPQRLTFKAFRREMTRGCGPLIGLWAIVGFILGLVLLAICFWDFEYIKAEYKAKKDLAIMFDIEGTPEHQAEQRRELAKSILVVKRFDHSIAPFQRPEANKRLAIVARTGEPLDLDPAPLSRLHMFKPYGIGWLIAMASLASLVFGWQYLDMCDGYRSRRPRASHKLPWRRPWTWLVPLLMPWLVPHMIRSWSYERHDIRSRANAPQTKK